MHLENAFLLPTPLQFLLPSLFSLNYFSTVVSPMRIELQLYASGVALKTLRICQDIDWPLMTSRVFCARLCCDDVSMGSVYARLSMGFSPPLVLSTTGSLGNEATVFYKRLADLLSIKQQKHYSVVMCWLRCRLGFAILCSAITCMRGSRSSRHRPTRDPNIPLAASEGLLT